MAGLLPAMNRFHGLTLWPLALVGFLAAAFWWFVVQDAARLRETYLAAGERDATNLARAFGEHARRSFNAIESALHGIERDVQRAPSDIVFEQIFERQRELKGIGAYAGIYDRDGTRIASNFGAQDMVRDIADTDFFRMMRMAPAGEMVIGRPYVSVNSREWSIPFGLTLRDDAGLLTAIVVITARAGYFEEFYTLRDFGPTGALTVLSHDGLVYARSGDQTLEKGKVYPQIKVLELSAKAESGVYRGPGTLRPDSRIFAWRNLGDYPLFVFVSLGEADVLAEFTRHRNAVYLQSAAISGLALTLAGAASFFLWRARTTRQQLARSEQHLREAIEALPDGFALYDSDDRLALWNEKYLELLPFLRRLPNLRGMTYEDVCRAGLAAGAFGDTTSPETMERWLAERLAAHRDPPPQPIEFPLKSGRWVLLQERLTADGGVVGVRTDVTALKGQEIVLRTQQDRLQRMVSELEAARRQLEKQAAEMASLAEQNLAAMHAAETAKRAADQARVAAERANRAKTRFLANMSHELRTPLNAIIGFSEIMKSELLGPILSDRYREYIRDIHASGKHLLALISDILDMSKIEAEKFTLHPAPVDITQVAEGCGRMMQVRAVKANLALVLDVRGDLNIVADERAVTQMLLNLLSNAIKFTPAGGLVTLRARPEGSMIVVQVIDTGIGIKPENLPALGERFAQVDNVYTRTLEGTGLGLAISRGLAQLHGGSLQIDSTVGKGTTVTVRLPRNIDDKESSAA